MTIGTVLTIFWLFLTVFDDWYTVGTVLVDLWRFEDQWFWVFLMIGTVYHSSKTFKRQPNSKNDHWCTNRHITCLHRVRRIHKAAQTPLFCETCITCAWAVATAHRPWAGLTVCVYMDVHASGLAPVRRVLLHSLLPTDDACSSSSLSTTVIKFSIFSDPTRKLSALPPELHRIR